MSKLPDKYKPSYPADIFKCMAAGQTDTEVFAKWGISKATFYRWLKEIPDLKEAKEMGEVQYEAFLDQKGRAGMLKTEDIDPVFWKELCKYKLGRSEKQLAQNTQINIENMNVLNQQTNDELLEYIKSQMDQNPELKNIIDVTPE